MDLKTGTPLAIGAAAGGVLGKQLFSMVKAMASNASTVGGVQAICLVIITIGTLIYTVNKGRIQTKNVACAPVCLLIGFLLGIMSSFLGIGGGPINLVVLYYFFSMDTKIAAANSLYIILFSQITGLLTTLVTKTVPDFSFVTLVVMVSLIIQHTFQMYKFASEKNMNILTYGEAWSYLSTKNEIIRIYFIVKMDV